MQDGDIVLTVFDSHYRFISTVIAKIHSADLASAIWGRTEDSPEGVTWEYMYILSKPLPIKISVTDKPVVDFLNSRYMGFFRIGDDKLSKIRAVYDSLENFAEQVFSTALPSSVAEKEIEQVETDQVLLKSFFEAETIEDERKKVVSEIVRRRGQPKFRKDLIAAYSGRCTVTDCSVSDVLEAAHIIGYMGEKTNHVTNGLLLRADIHTLYDLGLLRIDAGGRVRLDDSLLNSDYKQYEGKRIRLPENKMNCPDSKALAKKFSKLI